MLQALRLTQQTPLASGAARHVYAHPGQPGVLVKVMRSDLTRARAARVRTAIHREIHAYVDAHLRAAGPLPFLQTILGFAHTDLGLGLLVEAVTDENGALGPTLTALLHSKRYAAEHAAALAVFIHQIQAAPVVAADINSNNLVFTRSPDGIPRFVLVDGLGDKILIPFGRLSAFLNQRQKRKRIERLRRYVASGGTKR